MNKKKLPKAIRPESADAGGAGAPSAAEEPAPARARQKTQSPRPSEGASTRSEETPSPETETAAAEAQRAAAEKVVERYSMYSGAAGLIPVPGVDLATVGGVQIQMLRRLSKIYDVPFSANLGKSLIAALAGALVPAASGMGAVSLVKSVPVAGTIVAVMAMPTLSAGATYAIGLAFIEHFASGGTLLNFNPPDYRAFLKRQTHKNEQEKQ
jgi:uncharacterized protein (DUF697 family)